MKESTTTERIRPTFFVCPTCEGVGFVLFESFEFAGFEEPRGLIRAKCEKCGGSGEVTELPRNTQPILLDADNLLWHYINKCQTYA